MPPSLEQNRPDSLTNVKALFAQGEPSFNPSALDERFTDLSDGAVFAIVTEEAQITVNREWLPRNAQLPKLGQVRGKPGVQKDSRMTFKLPLTGIGGVGSGVSTSTKDSTITKLLAACGYNRIDQKGTTTTADSTTTGGVTSMAVTDASGIGVSALVSVVDEKGTRHIRLVKTNPNEGAPTPTAGSIGLVPPLPAKVESGAVVSVAATFNLGRNSGSLSFIALEDHQGYRLRGCKGMVTNITGEGTARAMMEFSFEIAAYDLITGGMADDEQIIAEGTANEQLLTGLGAAQGALLTAASTMADILVDGSPFYWGDDATFDVPIASATLETGSTLTPKIATTGENANHGFQITQHQPVLSVQPYYDPGWEKDFDAGTVRTALLQIGNADGQMVGIALPGGQLNAFPGKSDKDGLIAQDVKILGTISGPTWAFGENLVIGFF